MTTFPERLDAAVTGFINQMNTNSAEDPAIDQLADSFNENLQRVKLYELFPYRGIDDSLPMMGPLFYV